ncbi:TMV resistance protein N [Morella rubra]|uniref:TMV resistance protein N n=1 Tax=Morella rubra TaxID=262757 RepID=A0A6A1WHB1_9ROSI|nr:TMV resistance protein N [Morella rubra]
MKILECKEKKQQLVLPVFYHVDPSEVRNQQESYGEALARHEDRFKDDKTKVQKWRTGLQEVANFAGWHLGNGDESKLVKEIVQLVSRIVNHTYLNVAKYPIGIEPRLQDVSLLLSVEMNDVRMVGIVGIGGIGKTTIAKAIYNLMAYQFESSCFLSNVSETSKREGGLVQLQETLLCEILGSLKYEDW